MVKGCNGAVAFLAPKVVFVYYFVSLKVYFEVANYVFFNDIFDCAKVIKGSEGTYIVDWFALLLLRHDMVNFEYTGKFTT